MKTKLNLRFYYHNNNHSFDFPEDIAKELIKDTENDIVYAEDLSAGIAEQIEKKINDILKVPEGELELDCVVWAREAE